MILIGVSGKLGTGKDEFAKVAIEEFGAKRFSFADALKQEVKDFLIKYKIRFDECNLYGTQEEKEQEFSFVNVSYYIYPEFPEFKRFVKQFGYTDSWFHDNFIATYRSLLQWWGSEYRRKQNENYWVDIALEKIKEEPNTIWVNTDVRFPNEADAIKENGGQVIRLERKNNFQSATSQHQSEIALDNYKNFDYHLENNGTLDEYHDKVRFVMNYIIEGGI